MKSEVYFGIAFRLVLLFTVSMMATFIPEHLREFFGDTPCNCKYDSVDTSWDWGPRHYWYAWMTIFLFILTLINLGMQVGKLVEKHYPDARQTN